MPPQQREDEFSEVGARVLFRPVAHIQVSENMCHLSTFLHGFLFCGFASIPQKKRDVCAKPTRPFQENFFGTETCKMKHW